MGTNFTVSIEAASGVTTGISAADRAHTIKAAVAANAVGVAFASFNARFRYAALPCVVVRAIEFPLV